MRAFQPERVMSTTSQKRSGIIQDLEELPMEWWSGRQSGDGDQWQATKPWCGVDTSQGKFRGEEEGPGAGAAKAGMWDLEKGQHPYWL